MSLPSVAEHRKFVGTACLYRHLALRKPPFLQRNVDFALERHATLLAGAGVGGGREIRVNVAGWEYPTAEMMKDLVKGQKPVLRVDGLQMRRGDVVGLHG
jgi:hypothetical protein